jgi:hypothetical protein
MRLIVHLASPRARKNTKIELYIKYYRLVGIQDDFKQLFNLQWCSSKTSVSVEDSRVELVVVVVGGDGCLGRRETSTIE